MKFTIISLLSGLCFSIASFAASDDISTSPSLVFKTVEQAQKYCPAANRITFVAGQPPPGEAAKYSYLTATFSSTKNGLVFTNNKRDASCPVGTSKPRAVSTEEEHSQAKKEGATICYVMPTPVLKANKTLKHAELTSTKGNYGSFEKGEMVCNYQYRAVIDPATSKSLEGLVVLRTHKK